MPVRLRLGVLISGGGTNLQAILDACKQPDFPAEVTVVASNRPDAYGLIRAERSGVPALIISHKDFRDRESHESEIIRRISEYRINLILLAGYMRILTPLLINYFYNRAKSLPGIMNIHPADTREYQGAHGYEYALGMLSNHKKRLTQTWISVHFIDPGVDTGPIILQAPVPIKPDDTIQALRERGLETEHRVYPQAVRLYAEDRIKLENNRVVIQPA